jgi:hypothetical protein
MSIGNVLDIGWRGEVAFGLIWLGGLLDDTSCVLVLGGFYEMF